MICTDLCSLSHLSQITIFTFQSSPLADFPQLPECSPRGKGKGKEKGKSLIQNSFEHLAQPHALSAYGRPGHTVLRVMNILDITPPPVPLAPPPPAESKPLMSKIPQTTVAGTHRVSYSKAAFLPPVIYWRDQMLITCSFLPSRNPFCVSSETPVGRGPRRMLCGAGESAYRRNTAPVLLHTCARTHTSHARGLRVPWLIFHHNCGLVIHLSFGLLVAFLSQDVIRGKSRWWLEPSWPGTYRFVGGQVCLWVNRASRDKGLGLWVQNEVGLVPFLFWHGSALRTCK